MFNIMVLPSFLVPSMSFPAFHGLSYWTKCEEILINDSYTHIFALLPTYGNKVSFPL